LRKVPGHRHKPLLRPAIAVEVMIEGQEAVQVAALGIQGALRLAGGFGDEVECGEIGEMGFGAFNGGWNVMG
jgi:hypothetical protein